MGNTVSADEIKSQKKDFEFAKTSVPEVDDIYEKATTLLNDFEGFRIKIQQSIQKAHQLAGTNNLKGQNVIDPIRVMMVCFSSVHGGKLKDVIKFDTGDRVRIILSKATNITDKIWGLYQTVDEFMNIYHRTVEVSPEINQRIESLLVDMSELKKGEFIQNYTSRHFVSRREFDALVERNELTYLKMNKALLEWNNLHLRLGKEYRYILQHMDDLINEADEIGKKANERRINDPHEVFENFFQSS
jgi:small nuclear ribonucleoprotein (snRNP)-like protein